MKKLFLLLLCLIMTVSMVLSSCKDKKPEEPEEPGEETPGGENPGGENPGGSNPGGSNPGGSNPGGDNILAGAGIGAKISDLSFSMDDSGTGRGTLTATVLEGYVIMDESGVLNGYGNATLSLDYAEISRDDTINAKLFIENNVLYLSAVGTTIGTYQQDLDTYICMDVMKIAEFKEIADAMTEAQQTLEMLETNMPAIEQVINDSLAPIFAGVKFDGISEKLASYLVALTQSLYTSVDNGDGTKTLTFTVENLLEWNDMFAGESVAYVIDAALGEGTIEDIEAFFQGDNLYNFTVAELLSYLKDQQGVDVAVLLDTLDLLAAAATGTPGATIESLLPPEAGLPEGFDLSAFLEDEDHLALSVKDALKVIYATETTEQAVEMFKGMSADIIGDLKVMSVYDIVASVIEAIQQSQGPSVDVTPTPTPGGSNDAQPVNETLPTEPTEPTEPDPAQEIADMVGSYLGMIGQTLTLTFTEDSDGAIIGTNLAFVLPGQVETDGLTVTLVTDANGATFDVSYIFGEETATVDFDSNAAGTTLVANVDMAAMALELSYSATTAGIVADLELSAAGTTVVIDYDSLTTGTTLTASVANAEGELELTYASAATGFTLDVTFEAEDDKIVLDVEGGESGITAIIKAFEGEDEFLSINVATANDKLTVVLDINIDDDSAHAKVELVPVASITLDKSGLDALKAELAKGKEIITPAALAQLLTEKHEYAGKVLIDLENNLVYVVDVVFAEDGGDDNPATDSGSDSTTPLPITKKYNFNVQIIDISDCFGYVVYESCTDTIAVSANLNFEAVIVEGGAIQVLSGSSLNIYIEDIIDGITLADVEKPGTPAEAPILNNETVNILYNTKDQTYQLNSDGSEENTVYINGHTYVFDAAASNPVPEENFDCETVYYSAYKCSTCGDTYVRYTKYGHVFDKDYVYNETDGGLDVYKHCNREACDFDSVKSSFIKVNSALDFTFDSVNSTIVITVGENEGGIYRVYAEGSEYAYLHYSGDTGFNNLHGEYDTTIEMRAGSTYTFSVRANSYDGYTFNLVPAVA